MAAKPLPTEEEIGRLVHDAIWHKVSHQRLREIVRQLRQDPENAPTFLEGLAHSRRHEVRSWVARVAVRAGGVRSANALDILVDDASPYIREDAVRGLMKVAPEMLRPRLPAFRRQLRSSRTDRDVTLVLLDAIAQLQDVDAVDAVHLLATRSYTPASERAQASATEAFLIGGLPAVLDRIRAHDHEHIPWLNRLAWWSGTDEVQQTLDSSAATLPPDGCRQLCDAFAAGLRDAHAKHPAPYWDLEPPTEGQLRLRVSRESATGG